MMGYLLGGLALGLMCALWALWQAFVARRAPGVRGIEPGHGCGAGACHGACHGARSCQAEARDADIARAEIVRAEIVRAEIVRAEIVAHPGARVFNSPSGGHADEAPRPGPDGRSRAPLER